MSRISEHMESQLIGVNRRGAIAALAAGAAITLSPVRARQPDAPKPARRAKNVIFMVADGMSSGSLMLAELYSRRTRHKQSRWVRLMSDPRARRALQTTHSADGPVTDSSAAASTWGSGSKVNNGSVNITPAGRQLLPILVHAAQNGKRTGLITTTRVTHATPAGFSANAPKRDLEADIARHQIERGIDVLLGGGLKYFPDSLIAQAKSPIVMKEAAALAALDPAAASSKQTIGLFARHHIPFVTDRNDKVPSLPTMVKSALSVLSRAPDGFVMQIEGGRVDHAAHSSDAYALIRELTEFDDALDAVLSHIEGRDDTLVIITTDHGNANPGLTLYGKRGDAALNKLIASPDKRKSFEWIEEQFPSKASVEDKIKVLPDLIEQATTIRIDADDSKILSACLRNQRATAFRAANVWTFVLGAILADHFGVGFVSPNHTSDAVELIALGPGSELIPPWVDNVQLHEIMVAALGLAPGKLLPGMDEVVLPRAPKDED